MTEGAKTLPLTNAAIRAATPMVKRYPMTSRQREVLLIICRCIADGQAPPTLREIGQALGIRSTNGVMDHLVSLERKGLVQRGAMRSRDISVTRAGWTAADMDRAGDYIQRTAALVAGTAVAIDLSPQAAGLLDQVVASGLWGATRGEVVERMLCEKLRESVGVLGRLR